MMDLSIVILTCNQRAFTERVLDSLDELMLNEQGCDIIIVDNGSTDGTCSSIKRLNLTWKDRLLYTYLPQNIGVAAGRNVGLNQAKRKVILTLDNDTIVNGDAIRYLYRRITADSSIGIIAPSLWSPSGHQQDSAKPFPGLGLKARHFISQKWRRSDENAHITECEPCYVIGACQMFRREVLETVGMLDEKIFYGPEDADFCIRVRNAGFRVIYDPRASIIHDWQRATSRHRFSRLSLLHIQGLLYFYYKHKRLF